MARPGAGLLASGTGAAPSRDGVAVSVADFASRDASHPVTVAGPRRSCTGLPFTTGRMWRASLYPPAESPRRGGLLLACLDLLVELGDDLGHVAAHLVELPVRDLDHTQRRGRPDGGGALLALEQ